LVSSEIFRIFGEILFYKIHAMKEKKEYESITISLSPEILSKLEAGDYNKSKLIDKLLTDYFKKEKGQGEALAPK